MYSALNYFFIQMFWTTISQKWENTKIKQQIVYYATTMPKLKNVDSRVIKKNQYSDGETHGFLSPIYPVYSLTPSSHYFDKEIVKNNPQKYT